MSGATLLVVAKRVTVRLVCTMQHGSFTTRGPTYIGARVPVHDPSSLSEYFSTIMTYRRSMTSDSGYPARRRVLPLDPSVVVLVQPITHS
jgi:hypothetical protein